MKKNKLYIPGIVVCVRTGLKPDQVDAGRPIPASCQSP